MEILNQLGSLILGAVPTMILFILLVVAYTVLVRRPLERTLAERRARTTGAVEQARGAISAAEAETAVYEDKLRSARAEVLAAREQRLKQRQAEREAALALARQQAQERVRQAREEIAASAESARHQIEGAVDELGQRIIGAILPSGANVSGVRQ
jgi:F-type H+-transporting ATPase subunit b